MRPTSDPKPVPARLLRLIARVFPVMHHNGSSIFRYPSASWHLAPFPSEKGVPYVADNLATVNAFTPQNDSAFFAALQAAEARWPDSATPKRDIAWRLHVGLWAAQLASRNCPGADFLELGTGRGYMAEGICTFARIQHLPLPPRFFLVDRFEQRDDPVFSYADDVTEIERHFSAYEEVEIVRGDAPECLSGIELSQLAFIHVDFNDAAAEIAALQSLRPHFTAGTVLLFDDTGQPGREEQLDAHIQFARQLGRSLLQLPTGQALLVF